MLFPHRPTPSQTTSRAHPPLTEATPFEDAEQAWFWFIQAQQARQDGARIRAGQGLFSRPCEPVDMLRILDRLYRQRRLLREHLLVLAHYGRRMLAPDANRAQEARALLLWREALDRLTPVLQEKGVVQ